MSVVIPTYGQAAANLNPGAAPQRLAQDVQNLAPLATTYHSAQPVQYADYVAPKDTSSNLQKFGHFLGGLASQTGGIAEGAGKWLATQAQHLAVAPIHYGAGLAHGLQDRSSLAGIDAQNSALSSKMDNLSALYKSGKISSKTYKAGIKDISQDLDNNNRAAHAINTKVASDQKDATQATIDTASLLTTILTAGFGKAAATEVGSGLKAVDVTTAGQYLKSKAASAYLGPVENAIGKFAGDSKAFNALNDAAKTAVQKSTAEVVSTGANMSAGQIARASAANLALKYPIYYNLISSTGDELYTELQNKKYGDAVNTLAFNAALVLSGGPIGQAVKYLGKFAKGTVGATFGQSSFMDIASKELFGDEAALYNAAKDNPVYAKAIKTLEATHMSVTGNDPVAAAWRLINGERSVDGVNAIEGGATAWLDHLVKWAANSKEATAVAERLGLGNVILGRWTANNATMVADAFRGIPKGEWQSTWDGLKAKFPNSAFANNPNLDAQISHYIANSKTDAELSKSINAIEAGRYVGDFPKTLGQKYAKDGFVVISSPKNAQSFREGEGPLATKFATGKETAPAKPNVPEVPNVFGKDGAAWQDYNQRYSGLSPYTAKTQAEANGVLNGDPKLWPKTPESKMLNDVISGDKKVASPDNASYNGLFETKAKQAGLSTAVGPHGGIFAAKDPATLKAYFTDMQKGMSPQTEHSYIGYKPERFTQPTQGAVEGGVDTSAFFTHAVQPLPVLGSVGSLLKGLGLSPQASSERTYQLFTSNVAANLEKTSAIARFSETTGEVDEMMKKLSSYAHDPTRTGFIKGRPVTDLRMLTNKDIQTALSVTRSQAREIQNAISLAHIQIPLATKGLGERAVDVLYSAPGLRAVSRRFLKTQGILRFGANPFFQYLRVIPKTEILSASEGGGFVKTLWNGQARELKSVRTTLRQAGLLDEVGHLGGGLAGGEAVDFLGAGGGKNLAKKLLPAQENSIAGIILDQAKRMGMSTEDYINQFPEKAKDTIQMIAEYDKKSSFLNSPLARTLNVAVFPFRFDAKVLSIMGRNLAKTDLFTQVAFVKGMMGAHDWLNSPQGQAWYAQNADAIGLFKYITPFASFNEIFHSLVPGHDHSLGNFGQLGGLPFGWIPSLLDAEGLTHFNAPGVDPKTGQTFTKYIPNDAKGQVATAIQDMLTEMFSYPGATVGLPSKNKVNLALSEGVTGAKSSDFNKKGGSGATTATAPADNSYAPLQSATIPAQSSPVDQVTVKQPKVSSRLTSKKKKKSEFTPQLLPGQSQLGQL